MDELISVIVPIYMGEKWLARCIETIRNQTFSNLEIVLVDDGSPDRCGAISEEYAKKDSRIKVVHKENGGLSDARNAGIKASNGQYIMFVDEDDMIHPQMIELMYQTMAETESDIVVCNFVPVPDEDITDYPKIEKTDTPVCFEGQNVMNQLQFRNLSTVVAWNKLYKRRIYREHQYIKGRVHDDESAIHFLLHACNKIAYMNEILYYYVQRDGSITSKRKWTYYTDGWQAYEERLSFLQEKGYSKMTVYTKEQMLRYACNYYPIIYKAKQSGSIPGQIRHTFKQLLADSNVRALLTRQQLRRYHYFSISPILYQVSISTSLFMNQLIEVVKRPVRAMRARHKR